MSATSGYFPPPATESNCPGPMTRAALLALRTGGQLSVNCHYVITDHVQGTLAAGTTVTLHAVSSSELSEEARVNTLFDNESWFGIYDLDASSIIYLRDNRGNEVDGATQVGQFDWGNTSYSYFKVLEGSSLAVNIGNTAIKQRVTVSGASVLNLTGFTGNISDCEITENAQCSIANTSLTFTGNTVTDSTQVFGSLLTAAGSSVQRCVLRNSSLTLTGAGAVTMFDTDVLSSTVTHNSSGTVLWGTCTFSGGATVQHTGTGAQSLTRVRVLDGGRVLHTGAGTLTGLNSEVSKEAFWTHSSTGAVSITDHTTTGGAACRVEATGSGVITLLRGKVEIAGQVRTSTGTITATDFEVRGGVECIAPATAASTVVLNGGACERSSKITNSSSAGGPLTGTRVYLRGVFSNNTAPSVLGLGEAATSLTVTDMSLDSGVILLGGSSSLVALRVRAETNSIVNPYGSGTITLTDVTLSQNASIQTQAGALTNVTMTNSTMAFNATVLVRAGSAGTVVLEDAILQRGLIDKRATSTAGTFRFGHIATAAQTTTLDGATIAIIGNANYTIAGGKYATFATVNFSGDRDVQHLWSTVGTQSVINHTGTGGTAGTILDRIFESRIDRSTVNFTATGAVQNSLEMAEFLSTSVFNVQGTTSGQRWVRWKMAAFSTATFNNVTAAMIHSNVSLWDSSTLTYTNGAVAKNIDDTQVTSGSVFTITSPTVAGLINRLTIFSRGTITVSGPVGTVSRSHASAGGILNFTGGAAHANVTATMAGALTMPFDTGNVYHNTNANTTTTAANTNRGRDFFNNNII
jgi:hypothetical protein